MTDIKGTECISSRDKEYWLKAAIMARNEVTELREKVRGLQGKANSLEDDLTSARRTITFLEDENEALKRSGRMTLDESLEAFGLLRGKEEHDGH